MPVSKLKAELLEYVRRVEQGQAIEVTKDGKAVAQLVPIQQQIPIIGFSPDLEIVGDLELDLSDDWNVLRAAERD